MQAFWTWGIRIENAEKGEGRREKGEGRREKGEGRWKRFISCDACHHSRAMNPANRKQRLCLYAGIRTVGTAGQIDSTHGQDTDQRAKQLHSVDPSCREVTRVNLSENVLTIDVACALFSSPNPVLLLSYTLRQSAISTTKDPFHGCLQDQPVHLIRYS